MKKILAKHLGISESEVRQYGQYYLCSNILYFAYKDDEISEVLLEKLIHELDNIYGKGDIRDIILDNTSATATSIDLLITQGKISNTIVLSLIEDLDSFIKDIKKRGDVGSVLNDIDGTSDNYQGVWIGKTNG